MSNVAVDTNPTKLLTALCNGEELTSKQISARYKVVNPRDLVYKLRQESWTINLIERTNSKGVVRRKYSMSLR